MSAYSEYAAQCELRTLIYARDDIASLSIYVELVGDAHAFPVSGDAIAQLKGATETQRAKRKRLAAAYSAEATTCSN